MANLHDDNFDSKHFRRGEYNVRRINSLYKKLIDEITSLQSIGRIKATKLFSFSDYPDLDKSANKLFEQFTKNVTAELFAQVEQSWKFAEAKQTDFINKIASKLNLSKERVKEYTNPNKEALKAFKNRKENGMNLSDRVWKLSDQFRIEIELGLDVGIGEGKSAAKLARELRSNLNDPDRLFRRVRDKHGNLVLSKAAKAYHPGQGVYRSSAKNAQRLTRTENNMAYHEANYQKYQEFDFVVGIQIKLSNNPNHCPFCEAMAGEYPKDFKFIGWHPMCRCTSITILKTWEEMERDNQLIWDGKEPLGSVNEVKEVPKAFSSWIQDNKDKIENAKVKPYFIRDNPRFVNYVQNETTKILKDSSDNSDIPKFILERVNHYKMINDDILNLKSQYDILEEERRIEAKKVNEYYSDFKKKNSKKKQDEIIKLLDKDEYFRSIKKKSDSLNGGPKRLNDLINAKKKQILDEGELQFKKLISELSGETKMKINGGGNLVDDIVNDFKKLTKGYNDDKTIAFLKTSGREGFDSIGRTVNINTSSSKYTIMHELAHSIELDESMLKKSVDFLERRTKGGEFKYLKDDVNKAFNGNEMYREGGFFNPYVGKHYKADADSVVSYKGIAATEIYSMGIEEMYRNPTVFYMKDPDHFMFIFNLFFKKR
ncbi:hypothetical protein [Chryseobacterium defluvii]|uniref:Phage Mu protein F like protein n=1 Tax=Chryseobacterium defluvii TaxID=160396 RepID=A0A495SNJ2_9FLAO|nr:hypothetical protein [Chryseobacterium defluvii]RKT01092.1 hypothetical protein BCF58_0306 [Chryseobacterium defluvii]